MAATQSVLIRAVALAGAAALGGVGMLAWQHRRGEVSPAQRGTVATAMVGASDKSSAEKSETLWRCSMHPLVIQDHPGLCPICHMPLTPMHVDAHTGAGAASSANRKVLYYWDPMLGPASIAHAPGKSAMGMDLVPVFEDQQSAGPSVRIDPVIVQNMGVRNAEVVRGPLRVTVRAVGILEVPEPAVHEVNLRVNGWIEKLYANTEGMILRKGEPLFDLYSPDVQVAEEELIGAVKSSAGLDANASEAVHRDSQSMIDSAKQKLRLWGISAEDIEAIAKSSKASRTIAIRSPVDGDLVEKTAVEGSAVQAGMKLMRIEDHKTLWLNAQVYEEQMASIALGQTVQATVDGVPGKTFTGPVSFIYPHVDHMTRTVLVRIALDNPKHELRPGMFATANIITNPVADAVIVPREAVIDTGTRQIAFVAEPEGHFDPRTVRMGLVGDDDRVQIMEGLAPGEIVVTSGQFLMDVESRTTEAVNKLRSGSTPGNEMPGVAAAGAMNSTEPAPVSSATTEPMISGPVLAVAHCPMKNADWLQVGDEISNPYFGTSMATCGSVTKKVSAPAEGSRLDPVADNYLLVAKGLDADKIDGDAIQALKAAVNKLPNDENMSLQQSITKLVDAVDVEGARAAFQSVSAELIHMLDQPAK